MVKQQLDITMGNENSIMLGNHSMVNYQISPNISQCNFHFYLSRHPFPTVACQQRSKYLSHVEQSGH